MSAFDPKRTWPLPALLLNPIRWPVLSLGGGNEAARVHHAYRRCGGAWPLAARAQQVERVRHIGVLMNAAENDPEQQARLAAFRQRLQQLGWTEGRNVRIDYRLAAGDAEDHSQICSGIGRAGARRHLN